MGESMRLRSGLGEGLDVTLRLRKPADAMELHDWMAQDVVPMHAALDEIWTGGSRMACVWPTTLSANAWTSSVPAPPASKSRERVRKWAVGERWTPEMRDAQQAAIRELAHARKRFADYARARLGLPEVDLFSQVEQPDKQEWAALASGNGANAPTPIALSPDGS
jgi:hypothetical protein